MRCPTCEKNGVRSKVFMEPGSMTAAYYPPYYDEDGKLHQHDANTGTQTFNCSQGHRWTNRVGPKPCWCGWPESVQSPASVADTQ